MGREITLFTEMNIACTFVKCFGTINVITEYRILRIMSYALVVGKMLNCHQNNLTLLIIKDGI